MLSCMYKNSSTLSTKAGAWSSSVLRVSEACSLAAHGLWPSTLAAVALPVPCLAITLAYSMLTMLSMLPTCPVLLSMMQELVMCVVRGGAAAVVERGDGGRAVGDERHNSESRALPRAAR